MKGDIRDLQRAHRDMMQLYQNQNGRLEAMVEQLASANKGHETALAEVQQRHAQELSRTKELMHQTNVAALYYSFRLTVFL